MSVKHLLIVEPDGTFLAVLENTVGMYAQVDSATGFSEGRARLLALPPDLLVTNLRLGAFNGLHLVYLLASLHRTARAVVYASRIDVAFAREVQRAGAFGELQWQLPYVLPTYLTADLPPVDRRDTLRRDRRALYRGGRRASDGPLLDGHAAHS